VPTLDTVPTFEDVVQVVPCLSKVYLKADFQLSMMWSEMTLHCSQDRVDKKELKRSCEIHGLALLKDPSGKDEAFLAEGGRSGSLHQWY